MGISQTVLHNGMAINSAWTYNTQSVSPSRNPVRKWPISRCSDDGFNISLNSEFWLLRGEGEKELGEGSLKEVHAFKRKCVC